MSIRIAVLCLICALIRNPNAELIEKSCNTTEQCQVFIEKSQCIGDVCQCDANDFLSGDHTKCLSPADGFGSSCIDDVQCSSSILGSGGHCSSETNMCACQLSHHYLKGQCWPNVQIDESCFMDELCVAGSGSIGTKCSENEVCQCQPEWYYEYFGTCRLKAGSGEPCLIDKDCWCNGEDNNGGVCLTTTRVCDCKVDKINRNMNQNNYYDEKRTKVDTSCPPGFFNLGDQCVPELGSNCEVTENCKAGLMYSICVNGICACDNTRSVSADNRNCIKGIK